MYRYLTLCFACTYVTLLQVTKDSLAKVAEVQDRVTEAHSRFADTSKRLQEVESERRKLEFSLQQAQVSLGGREGGREVGRKRGREKGKE